MIPNVFGIRCEAFLLLFIVKPDTQMVSVSGEDNHTRYSIFLVSGVELFTIFLLWNLTPKWFWYQVKIITPDTHYFGNQVWSFLLLFIVKPNTQMVLVSGEDNHTCYPIFLLSGVILFYYYLLWNLTPTWFWYQVQIITPDTQYV